MILQELVRLASAQELMESAGYERKRLDFVLRIRPDGTYLNLESRRDEDGRGQWADVPRVPKRTSAIAPALGADNAKYVLAIGAPDKAEPARLGECKDSFAKRMREAAAKTTDEHLRAGSDFYEKFEENRAAVLVDRPASEWTGSEFIAFIVDGEERLLHEARAFRDHWATLRAEGTATGRCLVTGDECVPTRLHAAVKGLTAYGGQSSGTTLVSFNSSAFESHGHDQGSNAPVSRKAAEAYVAALTWLLERPPGKGSRRHRFGVGLGDSAVTVFWARDASPAVETFASLWDRPDPAEARAFHESPFKGLAPADLDESAFFALTLGGNAARLVVRDWIETTIGSVKANMRQYFADLQLAAPEPAHLPIWKLLAALDPPGSVSLPPALGGRIYRSSLTGTGMPRELLRHALSRLRVNSDEKHESLLTHQRVCIVKAVLCGLARKSAHRRHLEVQVSLDETNTSIAYVLGRLFALIEWIQGAAQRDLNKTIRDRFFGAASSTPAMVFGRLLRLSAHHEAKVGGGLAYLFDERKRAIMAQLDASPLPSYLPLEDQGLFAVGYYHERDWLFSEAKRRKLERELEASDEIDS